MDASESTATSTPSRLLNGQNSNSVESGDRPIHDWYRFVLSYPPHLVRHYFAEFGLAKGSVVLDPFSGTGTTVVEAKLNHLRGIGVEANPFAHFAGSVKVDWGVSGEALLAAARGISRNVLKHLAYDGIYDNQPFGGAPPGELRDIPQEAKKLLISDSISPLPLHKTLVLLDEIRRHRDQPYSNHLLLAVGKCLVTTISNLKFGPEVGIGRIRDDAPVILTWFAQVERMAADLNAVYRNPYPAASMLLADAREIESFLPPQSVDAVITSPPYPNEKDYTRATRLESVLLGFYGSTEALRGFKKTLLRSNTRGVYKDDTDHLWVADNDAVQKLAQEIESRRINLGKTSGFEKTYGRLTLLYFGGMAKHLAQLRLVLRPGAHLAYVVGDQASYFRIMIRTGELLGDIAARLGYELVKTDLFRTRFATASQAELREEIVVLRWPG